MAEKTTPIKFMHQLMYKLSHTYQDDTNKLNLALADLTDIVGLPQITDWTQLRDMIKADITTNLNNGGTAKDFLKEYCNIDLDNDDCGALIGYDCSGGEILTNDNIINEEGDLQTHTASAVIRGCTVSFPTFSDSTYNYVMDGLYTWWVGLPFDLVNESYGLGFTDESFVTTMPLDLFDQPPSGGLGIGAYVSSRFDSTGTTVALELCVNMNDVAFGTIIIGDKSGNTTSGWFAALDRVLAHELTHAVMSANIRGFNAWLPDWFCEGGTVELVNGCDDSRTSALMQAAVSTAIIDDGFSASPTSAREYSVGFIAMRYLLKKYTDRQVYIHFPVKPKEPFEVVWEKMAHGIRSEHCISRDGDLNKIMDEFIDFCQRDDYNLVQPWTLCSNKGSKTLRIPLEGHEKKTEDTICTYIPDLIVNWDACCLSNNFVAKVDTSEDELFPSGSLGNFYYNDIDSLIAHYNAHDGSSDYSITHIIVIFEGEELTLLSKSDYLQLLNTLDSSRLDKDNQQPYLLVIQANLIPFNKYDTLESMSNGEFYSYFTEELSVEAQNRIQWLLSQGAYFLDIRLEELDKCGLSDLSTPSASSIWKNITRTHANYPPYYKSSAEDPYNWNDLLLRLIERCKVNELSNLFNVTKKQSTDFPCFYLSTGVFKPSTWSGQGLDYPSASLKNSNDEYIPFNIHVLNDVNMRFDLQGVGTCKKVTGKEGDADIMNSIRQTGANSYKADKISDVIPGVGCPLIVRSVENKDTYDTILCYFTKTNYSGTFTLIFYDEHDEEKPPVFQSVAFGLGISEEESYKYPLYTAGGTSGLYPAWYKFSYTVPGKPPVTITLNVYGNKFNFDMNKGDTLGSLLYPVATDRCGISNFRVLQSDGQWKSVINLRQYFYKDNKNTCGAYITKNNGDSVEDCLVYPTISNIENVDRFVLVQPITVIKKNIDGEDESGFLMSINGVKCKPDRLRSMFTALDGHEYLIVPNGWYDRTLGLPLREVSSDESLIDVIMDLLKHMPKQTYVLCIDLG